MKTSLHYIVLATSLFACGAPSVQTALTTPEQEPNQARVTVSGVDAQRAVDWPSLGRGADRFIRIDLGPDSYAECVRISPKFPFDSASTYAIDRAQLAALAECLNSPTMRDHTILLVGRADPRGTEAYNDKLGMERANAIKGLLVEQGIDANRIEVDSEGKSGALSDRRPEFASGYDRRVDVIVQGSVHAP